MKHIFDDSDKNKYEALSKAETLSLLQQVIESGELPEGELNGLVITIRNPIDNKDYKVAFCTQAKYNELDALGELETDCLYFITDDTTYDGLVSSIEALSERIDDNTSSIETNAININKNTNDITTNRTNITKNSTDLNAIKGINLYLHTIRIKSDSPKLDIQLSIYNDDETAFTSNNILSKFPVRNPDKLWCTGIYNHSSIGTIYSVTFWNVMLSIMISIEYFENGASSSATFTIDEMTNFTITDNVTPMIRVLNYTGLDEPIVTEEITEEGDVNYYDVIVTNPHPTPLTLCYKESTETTYTNVTIAANGTYTIGNYVEGSSGTVYLTTGKRNSNVITWRL